MSHSTILIQRTSLTNYCDPLKIGKCGLGGLGWGIKTECELFVLEVEL